MCSFKEGEDVENRISTEQSVAANVQEGVTPNIQYEGKVNSEVPLSVVAPHFNPRTAFIELTRYGITGGISFASSAGLEAVSFAGATLAANYNLLANQDTKVAVATLALSYMPLIWATLRNAHQAWETLRETGTSVSFLAKVGYDLSRKITDREKIQKIATYLGFTGIELMKEIPWYAAAIVGGKLVSEAAPGYYTPNAEISFLTGANIFGAGYQYAQAEAVGGVLRGIQNRRRIMNIFKRNPQQTEQNERVDI